MGNGLARWVRKINPFVKALTTLAIEEDAVHLVVFRGDEVVKWRSLPLPLELVKGGGTADPVGLGKIVSKFLDQNRVKGKILCCVSGFHSLSRIITLPRLPVAALNEAVKREMSRVMPIPVDETHVSWQPLSRINGQQTLFVLATPRHNLESMAESLRRGKALGGRLELKPLALARLAEQKQSVIVDIQVYSTDIIIAFHGVPALFRTMSREEGDPISKVAEEVSRTIDFFNRDQAHERLQPDAPLFLTGPLADDEAIVEELSAAIRRPRQPLDIPLMCPQGFSSRKYATNLGLAMSAPTWKNGDKVQCLTLNMLPSSYRPSYRAVEVSAALAAIPLGLLAMFLLYQMSAEASLARDRSQANWYLLNQKLAENKLAKKEVTKVELAVKDAQAKAEGLEKESQSLLGRSGSYGASLALVHKVLPPEASLESATQQGSQVTVGGKASSSEAVVKYIVALEESRSFSSVSIRSMSRPNLREPDIAFSLELTLK